MTSNNTDTEVIDLAVESLPDLEQFRGLAGHQRDEAYLAVEREVRRLQALQASMLSEVRQSRSFLGDFHHTVTAWVQAVTNCSRSTAVYRTRTAHMLTDLVCLADAVAAGEVGADQVRLLSRLHANDRCRHQLGDSEELLIGYARTLTLHEFRQVCQRWEQHADPDGAHRDHETSRANRSVKSSALGAGHQLHAEGDALTGDVINEILDKHAEAEFETDLTERRDRYGDDAGQHPLARTARQRRYDAMLAIFLKAAATTDTSAATRVPTVNIFCTEATLQDAIRGYFRATSTQAPNDPANPPPRFRLCETASGAPVDPHDLVVAALIGQVRRVVVDSAGRVINLGRRSRLFVGAAREAVLLSGDRCCWPGCDMRAGRIQIDHLSGWATLGGATNPHNGGPECPAHNRSKERGRITVKRDHAGWHHYRPDGSEITPRAG